MVGSVPLHNMLKISGTLWQQLQAVFTAPITAEEVRQTAAGGQETHQIAGVASAPATRHRHPQDSNLSPLRLKPRGALVPAPEILAPPPDTLALPFARAHNSYCTGD